jgi:diketogulonate reductase-like aldo/keto reductase
MRAIAEKYDAIPAEVALNWLLKDNDVIPIPGAKKISHVETNIHATTWELTNKEYDKLTKLSDELELNTF